MRYGLAIIKVLCAATAVNPDDSDIIKYLRLALEHSVNRYFYDGGKDVKKMFWYCRDINLLCNPSFPVIPLLPLFALL